jgi:hypothetical protein
LLNTTPVPETSASPVALPDLHDALVDDPSEDADEDEDDSAFDNEDEGE